MNVRTKKILIIKTQRNNRTKQTRQFHLFCKTKHPNMRISLFTVLCATICSSSSVVLGEKEVSDEREMAATFTFAASVMWYNDNASSSDCTDAEQTYIMDKMAPNLDLILSKDGYNPVPWSKSRSKVVRGRFLRGEQQPDRELTLCSDCIARLPTSYCNAMYNCGYRRTLTVEQQPQEQQHHREDQELTTLMTTETTTSTATAMGIASKIQTEFTSACTAQLTQLSSDLMLQSSCRQAMAGCVCQATVS